MTWFFNGGEWQFVDDGKDAAVSDETANIAGQQNTYTGNQYQAGKYYQTQPDRPANEYWAGPAPVKATPEDYWNQQVNKQSDFFKNLGTFAGQTLTKAADTVQQQWDDALKGGGHAAADFYGLESAQAAPDRQTQINLFKHGEDTQNQTPDYAYYQDPNALNYDPEHPNATYADWYSNNTQDGIVKQYQKEQQAYWDKVQKDQEAQYGSGGGSFGGDSGFQTGTGATPSAFYQEESGANPNNIHIIPDSAEVGARRNKLPYEQGYNPDTMGAANPATLFGASNAAQNQQNNDKMLGAIGGAIGDFWNSGVQNIKDAVTGYSGDSVGKVGAYARQQEAMPEKMGTLAGLSLGGPTGAIIGGGLLALGGITDVAGKAGFKPALDAQSIYNNVVDPLTNGTWNQLVYDVANGKVPLVNEATQAYKQYINTDQWRAEVTNDIVKASTSLRDQMMKVGYTEEQANAAAMQYSDELAKNPLKASQAAAQQWMQGQDPIVQLGVGWFNPIQNAAYGYFLGGEIKPERRNKSFLQQGEGYTEARPILDTFKPQYAPDSVRRTDPIGIVANVLQDAQKYVAPGTWIGAVAQAMKVSRAAQYLAEPFRAPQQNTHQQEEVAKNLVPALETFAKNTGQETYVVMDKFIDSPDFRSSIGFGVEAGPVAFKAAEEVANSLQALRAQSRYNQYKLGDSTQYTVTQTANGARVVNGVELSPQAEKIASDLVSIGRSQAEADQIAAIHQAVAKAFEAQTGIPADKKLEEFNYKKGDPNNPDPNALYQMEKIHQKNSLGLNIDKETGEIFDNKTVKNEEVAAALQEDSRKTFGPALDPVQVVRDPKKYVPIIVKRAIKDYDYWLNLPVDVNGVKWYGRDVAIMERNAKLVFPELRDPAAMTLFKAVIAITSNGERPSRNFDAASKIWEVYRNTRQLPFNQPVEQYGVSDFSGRPKGWIGRGAETYDGLSRLQALIHTYGEKGAADWLNTEHPIEELSRWSSSVAGTMDEGQTSAKGWAVIGPKLGSFGNNLSGDFSTLTADMWWSRTYNRWIGNILNHGGEIVSSPRDEDERRVMRMVARELAKKYKLSVAEVQAAIWYAEQQAWKAQGADVDSDSYSEPSKSLAESYGLTPFHEPEPSGTGDTTGPVPPNGEQTTGGGTDAGPGAASRRLSEDWTNLPSIETKPGEINAAWQKENERMKAQRKIWREEDKARNEQLEREKAAAKQKKADDKVAALKAIAEQKANDAARKAAEKEATQDIANVSKVSKEVAKLEERVEKAQADKPTPKNQEKLADLNDRLVEARRVLGTLEDKAKLSIKRVEEQQYLLHQLSKSSGEVLGSYQKLDPATGKAVIEIMDKGDFNTILHEMGHLFRDRMLTPANKALMEKELGVKNGQWTRDAEERFADMWMDYISRGDAASPSLGTIFERFGSFLRRADATLKGETVASGKASDMFDRMMGRDIQADSGQFKTTAPGEVVTTPKGQDITTEYNQATGLPIDESVMKRPTYIKDWTKFNADDLMHSFREVAGLREGSKVLDEFGEVKDRKNLEDLGLLGKIAKGPTGLGDWMSDTMLNSIGRFFRDPAGNLMKSTLEGYIGINTKANIKALTDLGIPIPDLSGTPSKEAHEHSGKIYKVTKFVAQWPGMTFGKLVLNPAAKLGVPGIGKDVNTTVGKLEAGTKLAVFGQATRKAYYIEKRNAEENLKKEAFNDPAIRRLLETGLLTKQQVIDIVTGKLSAGDVKKLLTNVYSLHNYSPDVAAAADLLDPSINPHSWVKDSFDQLPPDTAPTDPDFVSRETTARQNVDDATWTVIDNENQVLAAQGGDPAFANTIKYPDYLGASLDNWQAGQENYYTQRYGAGRKPRPATLDRNITNAGPVKIGNAGLNSTKQLQAMAKTFLTADPAKRAVYIDHFQKADEALRAASGNTFKLDFGTMEPVRISDGAYLSTLQGRTTTPPIEPEGRQLIDPVERQRLIKVSEDIFGPGSTAVADMTQTLKDIQGRLGDLGQKSWAQMHPAERDLAASIVSRSLGFPDPTSVKQSYGIAMEQRQAAIDFVDKLKVDASNRVSINGTMHNGKPSLDDASINAAMDWMRNKKEEVMARAKIVGARNGKAIVDKMFFDYLDKNRIDQALSAWVPFSFWGRKNVAYLFRHMTQNPAHFAALLAFYQAMISENERLGIPSYARAYLKLWQNADGSYQMLNFSSFNPFNFGDSSLPLVTVKPDDKTAPGSAKLYNQQSLFELVLGGDNYSSSGEYYSRDIGGLGQFFRLNPAIAEPARLGLLDQMWDRLGTQKALADAGIPNQGHFGDDTTQGLGLVASRGITRSTAALGPAAWLRDFLKPYGITLNDVDLEGIPNEIMGRMRNAIENLGNEDLAKIYGKPKTKFDHEIMAMANEGKISADEGYALMQEFREGKLSVQGAKILDSVLAEDAGRQALSLVGLSTITTNTPRDNLVQTVLDAYGKVKDDKGTYKVVDGKQVFVPGKSQEFFDSKLGQAASVLFSSGDTAAELAKQQLDDKTRAAIDQLYADRDKIGSAAFYQNYEALQKENPSYFTDQADRNLRKLENPDLLKPGEEPPSATDILPGLDPKKKEYDLLTEQYRAIGGDRMNQLYNMNRISVGQGQKSDQEYNDMYKRQNDFIKQHPDWYAQYSKNIESKPKDPIVLQKGESYKTDVKSLADRQVTAGTTEYYNIGGNKYDDLMNQAAALKKAGKDKEANDIYNSQFITDIESAQAAYKKDHPDVASALEKDYMSKHNGEKPPTDADRVYFDKLTQYKASGGPAYDTLALKAYNMSLAGDKEGAQKIYETYDYKNGKIARDQFMKNNPDFEKQYAAYLKTQGESYTPPSEEDQKYFDALAQYQKAGGDKFDTLSAQARKLSDAGDKDAAGKIYNSYEYKNGKIARDQFMKNNPGFESRYADFLKSKGETYSPPSIEEQEYFDQLDQYKSIGGEAYDAKAKAVSDAYASGNKKLGAKLYKDPDYLNAKTARDVFMKDHPVFAAKYNQYIKETYGTEPSGTTQPANTSGAVGTAKSSGGYSSYPASSGGQRTSYQYGGSSSGAAKSSGRGGAANPVGGGTAGRTSTAFSTSNVGVWFRGANLPSSKATGGRATGQLGAAPGAGPMVTMPGKPTNGLNAVVNAKGSTTKLPGLTLITAAKYNWTIRQKYGTDLEQAAADAIAASGQEPDNVVVPMYQSGTGYILVSKPRSEVKSTDLTLLNKVLIVLQPYYPEFVQSVVQSLANPTKTVYNAKQPASVDKTLGPLPPPVDVSKYYSGVR